MNDETATRQRLERARALIDACYDQPLDLEQLAREASFSRYHFLRLFRQAFDQTPHQYLIERRLAEAKTLLAHGELSVTEVCFAVGFQSLGSFSALFHRAVGHPPRLYRARVLVPGWSPRVFVPTCFLRMFGLPTPHA
ncbi:MAG TPA: AraC family transcriptional regulator [Roseiflexaceae bacterium]|nr:AraC family transcriptional regulator [Roseiflexaceae bacterium]